MRKLPLYVKVIIALIFGIIYALFSSYMGWSEFNLNWINPFGDIFIRLLLLIAVPLVFFSIIKGIAGLPDMSKLGRIGAKTIFTYIITTLIAVTLGLTLVNLIEPGARMDEEQRLVNRAAYERWVGQMEGVEIIDDVDAPEEPEILEEVFEEVDEEREEEIDPAVIERVQTAKEARERRPLQPLVDIIPRNFIAAMSDHTNMLQIIFFAIFFGISLLLIPKEKSVYVERIIDGINEVFLKMVEIVMQAVPFFVFALMVGQVADMAGDNPQAVLEIFRGLFWYVLVVIGGLALMVLVIYPIILKLFARDIPYGGFFRGMSPAQTLAFSSSSSAATLPVTIECVQDNLGVSKEVTSFVLPIGATINMDGTSLYQAVAVVFLAQMHMIELTLAQQLTIVFTATMASIGSAAVPSAGIFMLVIVLGAVGLNPLWIGIIMPVDRILDMCRTVVNVTGDATVSSVIAKSEGELNYIPHHETLREEKLTNTETD